MPSQPEIVGFSLHERVLRLWQAKTALDCIEHTSVTIALAVMLDELIAQLRERIEYEEAAQR